VPHWATFTSITAEYRGAVRPCPHASRAARSIPLHHLEFDAWTFVNVSVEQDSDV
jgi:hypothetical protein